MTCYFSHKKGWISCGQDYWGFKSISINSLLQLLFSIFLFQGHNHHSDSSLCLIQSPWNQQWALRWLLEVLQSHLLESLHMPQCNWCSSTSCPQTVMANWASNWCNPSENHQKPALLVRQTLIDAETAFKHGCGSFKLSSGSTALWSGTPQGVTGLFLLSSPDHRIVPDRLGVAPAPLRAAGQHSCSSFQAESPTHPQSVARIKEVVSLSLCCFAPKRVKEKPGKSTRGSALFPLSLC